MMDEFLEEIKESFAGIPGVERVEATLSLITHVEIFVGELKRPEDRFPIYQQEGDLIRKYPKAHLTFQVIAESEDSMPDSGKKARQ
jgi:hypothetical protein